MSGVIHRVARADAHTVRTIAAEVVGFPCYTCGGAILWDMDAQKGTANLRELQHITSSLDEDASLLVGDFGHIFSPRAEVRWKRRAQDTYDVLILSDQPPTTIDQAVAIGGTWHTSELGKHVILQSNQRPPLACIYYYAHNGAVQFVRYVGQRKEETHE